MGLFSTIGKVAGAAIGFAVGGTAGAKTGAKIGGTAGKLADGKKKGSASSTPSGPSLADQLQATSPVKRQQKALAPTQVAKTGHESIKEFNEYDPTKTLEDPWQIANQWDEDLGGSGDIDFERYT